MSKQVPSDKVIIPTHGGYILPLQLLLGLPHNPLCTYHHLKDRILSHDVLIQNMDWNASVLDSAEAEYDEWFEKFGCWDGIAERAIHTISINALTNVNHKLPLPSNLQSNK